MPFDQSEHWAAHLLIDNLRNLKERFPDFYWDFSKCDTCAMGVMQRMGLVEWQPNDVGAFVKECVNILECDAEPILVRASGYIPREPGVGISPDSIADLLEQRLATLERSIRLPDVAPTEPERTNSGNPVHRQILEPA